MYHGKYKSLAKGWLLSLIALLTIILLQTAFAASSLELSPQRRGLALAVLDPGRIYLLDGMRNELVQLDTTGKELRQVGGFGSTPGLLQDPAALVARGGELYLLDRGLGRVHRYNRGLGLIWTIDLGQGLVDRFESFTHSLLALLPNGQLLTGDSNSRTVMLYTLDAGLAEPIIYPGHTGISPRALTAMVATKGLIHIYDGATRMLYSCDIWGEPQQQRQIPEEQFQALACDGKRLFLVGDGVVLELHTDDDTVIWHPAPWLPRTIAAAASVAGYLFVLDDRGNRIFWERY
ncbi:MAG: hypothetical protein ISR91_02820 [Candidatus Delongbacteria bacterium]|nr:hypothetical protein [Candidatus Delongbacteria bacterium]